ncbi:MAG: addiction module toxin RelE [Bacteroidetes bacterium RIFCSPLOWO2_12_FULL_31_6]|nr:MAG: addiction module toxin RelE [Bacteroidetes bacterium RIFCSPLOWO2_12_FULL_31_6]
MYKIEYSNKIKKEVKLAQKRGLDMNLFKEVVKLLEKNGSLPAKYKPHVLKGNFKGLWECHIQPDWLLIWEQNDTIKLIFLARTGTHSDLF